MYFLSVDGGGTKTSMLLCQSDGTVLAADNFCGCAYPEIGLGGLYDLLENSLVKLIKDANIDKDCIGSAAFGLPCYGEDAQADTVLNQSIPKLLPRAQVCLCNDVEVGHAGSLALGSGIHLVAGTGAIGFGRNMAGACARSNGWHEAFSDEGSAYWLGMQALSLFVKEADGRVEQGPLYSLFLQGLGLATAVEVVSYYNKHLAGNRAAVAQLQRILEQAARQGDTLAKNLYDRAAYELYLTAKAIFGRLDFSQESAVAVSYFGGVYHAGELILAPLRQLIEQMGAHLVRPQVKPVSGGILLAAQAAHASNLDQILENLKRQEATVL